MIRRLLWCTAILLLAASAVMLIRAGNAGDKNWLLLAARMWLSGKVLYVDIFEVNPPLVIWFYAVPVWLSRHLPATDSELLGMTGVFFSALSAFLGGRLIAKHPGFAGNPARQRDFALLLAAVFVFFNTQVYFFDRDHIFFVLAFPYMLRFMPSLALKPFSLPLRLGIALMAAVGFCIKPHTIFVFAAIQLFYVIRERRMGIFFTLENIIIYIAAGLYLASIWLFARNYLDVVLPMSLLTYSGFSRRINGYLFLSLAFVSAGLTLVELRLRDVSPFRRDTCYFIGICTAFLLYALAGNGWGYTYNPLLCMLLFLSGWMLWDYGWLKREAEAQGLPARRFTFGMQGCAVNLALNAVYMILCLSAFYGTASCAKSGECTLNDRYATYFKENNIHSFGSMSVNLRIFSSLARRTGADWDTRFNHLWMLPKLAQEGMAVSGKYQWIVDYIGKAYAEDLQTHKPDIVFVDRNNAIFNYPHPFDMVAFFSRVPEFKKAWHNYAYATTIDQCSPPDAKTGIEAIQIDCRFAIYRRISSAQSAPQGRQDD